MESTREQREQSHDVKTTTKAGIYESIQEQTGSQRNDSETGVIFSFLLALVKKRHLDSKNPNQHSLWRYHEAQTEQSQSFYFWSVEK